MSDSTGDADAQEESSGTVKKFMFVCRRAPHGTVYALEALEVVLISAAFDQDVSLFFLDDGVYDLVKGQQTKAIDVKNFSPASSGRGESKPILRGFNDGQYNVTTDGIPFGDGQ